MSRDANLPSDKPALRRTSRASGAEWAAGSGHTLARLRRYGRLGIAPRAREHRARGAALASRLEDDDARRAGHARRADEPREFSRRAPPRRRGGRAREPRRRRERRERGARGRRRGRRRRGAGERERRRGVVHAHAARASRRPGLHVRHPRPGRQAVVERARLPGILPQAQAERHRGARHRRWEHAAGGAAETGASYARR